MKKCESCGKNVSMKDTYKLWNDFVKDDKELKKYIELFNWHTTLCNECSEGIDYIENKELYVSFPEYLRYRKLNHQ